MSMAFTALPARTKAAIVEAAFGLAPAMGDGRAMAERRVEESVVAAELQREDVSDEGLILEIACGGTWAMETLYERYGRYAYSLAYRVVRDHVATEDIVQDAFLSVWRKAALYQRQQGSVRSWLQAIVHHRAIDYVRAAAHRDHQWTMLQGETEPERVDDKLEVWEEVWRNECNAIIRSVLAELPAEQREVIELGYFGGYTHAEIAQRWNIPLGTVKGRMRLGLRKMKQLLRERGVETSW